MSALGRSSFIEFVVNLSNAQQMLACSTLRLFLFSCAPQVMVAPEEWEGMQACTGPHAKTITPKAMRIDAGYRCCGYELHASRAGMNCVHTPYALHVAV
jgi:hypothetical protein